MQPVDHRGLHWQHAAIEREALFDACDRFLTEATTTARAEADTSTRRATCPDCGHQLGHQYRRWRGAILSCPQCPWEEPLS